MTVPTSLTKSFISTLTAHFREWITTEVIEQAYLGDELLGRLQRTNKIRKVGKYFHVPVNFLGDPLGDSFDGADVVSTAGADTRTIAEYTVSNYTEPVKVLWTDIQDAGDGAGIFSIMEESVADCRLRATKLINRDLCAPTQASTKDVIPLYVHIDPTPTSSTLGNIAQASNPTWANQTQSIGSYSGNYHKIQELSLDCRKGGLTDWDWAIADKDTYLRHKKRYDQYFTVNIGPTYDGNANGDITTGARRNDLQMEGRPLTYDLSLSATWTRYRRGGGSASVSGCFASTGGIFFINNRAFMLAVAPGAEFNLTDFESMGAGGQLGVVAFCLWRGQTVTKERSALGIAHSITD